jgi:hypothetical protein
VQGVHNVPPDPRTPHRDRQFGSACRRLRARSRAAVRAPSSTCRRNRDRGFSRSFRSRSRRRARRTRASASAAAAPAPTISTTTTGSPISFTPRTSSTSRTSNAGLRLYDTSDPLHVREVGYFMPPDPVHRFGVFREARRADGRRDRDARGYAYIHRQESGAVRRPRATL